MVVRSRCAENREFVHQILSRYGLDQNDTMGIIKLCKGLSLVFLRIKKETGESFFDEELD